MESGTRLGPYEILELLGKGGMGEVWLAEDSRLGRKVAIKTLPPDFAAEPERVARFEQEARAAAALNHPNIAVVFDVGEHDAGVRFIVQEYLEGQSLRELLRDKPPKLGRALTIGAEVAQALAVAHSAGIVHRDIKPDNIFILDSGLAKVLDFGLAKLVDPGTFAGDSADSAPTAIGTMAGAVMGTAGYMAPEQVEAGEIDGRTDVFALGCVLYEMATGQRPFAAGDLHSTLGRIVSDDPEPIQTLRPELPDRLGWIIDKCLAKDPARRYQHADDVAVDLRSLRTDLEGGSALSAGEAAAPRSPNRRLATVALILIALAAGTALGWGFGPGDPDTGSRVFRVELFMESGFGGHFNRVLSIAPDGSALVASSASGLWVRPMDDREGRLLTSAGDGEFREPTFSPDSQEVAFWSAGHLNRIRIDGSAPVSVGPAIGRPVGIAWGEDGAIYVGQGVDGIWRIGPEGGAPEQVAVVEAGQLAHGPELLPGGEWLVFSVAEGMSRWDEAQIVAHSLRTGERHLLVDGGREPRYAASGHLLFVRGRVLYAAALDLAGIPTAGVPVAVESSIRTAFGDTTGAAYYDVSDTGTLVYAAADSLARQVLVWSDADGSEETLPIAPQAYGLYRVAADQRRIAAVVTDPVLGNQVYLFEMDRPTGTRLSDAGISDSPVWGHDGEHVYYSSDRGGSFDIWRRRVDMRGEAELIYAAPGDQAPEAIFPDGSGMVFTEMSPRNVDIWRLDFTDGAEPQPLVVTPDDELQPTLSADGKLLAYQAFAAGQWVVYVLEIDTGRRFQVGEGYGPRWSDDGSRIFFSADKGMTIAYVEVASLDPFQWGDQQSMNVEQGDGLLFEVDATGQRVLVARNVDREGAGDIIAVTINWFDELRSRVPSGQ